MILKQNVPWKGIWKLLVKLIDEFLIKIQVLKYLIPKRS